MSLKEKKWREANKDYYDKHLRKKFREHNKNQLRYTKINYIDTDSEEEETESDEE